MSAIIVRKCQLVELYIPDGQDGQQRFNFQDIPQLRNKIVDFIECYNSSDVSTSPTGKTVINNATMIKTFITLYCSDMDRVPKGQAATADTPMGELLRQIPLPSLHRIQSTTNPFIRDITYYGGMRYDWSKCYLETGGTIGVDTVSYLFLVWYRDNI